MQCEDVLERLSAFVDDELDPLGSREIQEHLDRCPTCAEALGGMRGLGERLRAEAPYYPAPDSLRARVSQAAWREASRGRGADRRRSVATWGWLGAAATVVVVLGGAWLFTSHHGVDGFASMEGEVVSSHVRSLMASHLMDVASTDQHTVKPWFNGKLDFSPPVTDLAASGYPLIGGRLDYLRGRAVAALVYQRRKHFINVFTWPDEGAADSETPPRTHQGYHVVHETHGGMAYWIVSDLNPEELSAFARMLVTGK
ncbi:MAG TPA: anti-sigma factor [Candidatus Binatia bacterium]|nr:anti-sigma factor [Candidatus Binatia bacterium]